MGLTTHGFDAKRLSLLNKEYMSVITSPQHGAVVPSVSNSFKFNAHLPLAGFTPSGDLGPCAEKLGKPLLRGDPVGVAADAVWARPVARAADGAKI